MAAGFDNDNALPGWENVIFVLFRKAAPENPPQGECQEPVIIDLMQERARRMPAKGRIDAKQTIKR